ncbi:MAG TPA: hypothetical protein VL334_02155 [Anaerolineae bacterium]|nr:hypothetical protein [Anaerolineae bacterium]
MTKTKSWLRAVLVVLALLAASAVLTAWPRPLQAQDQTDVFLWGAWTVVSNQPSLSNTTFVDGMGPYERAVDDPDSREEAVEEWVFTYDLWQWGISSLSGLGPISPIQGRREVLAHAEEIKLWAPDDLELLVAASIAHQASDFKDRPFGTDALEAVWRTLVDDNISVGIAQLRQEEVVLWAPYLQGVDLLSPDAAIRIMTAKLSQTNSYILHNYPQVAASDRFMLLALAQNAAASTTMRNTVSTFFEVAGADWTEMLATEEAGEMDWQEQLRLVLLHAVWLVEQGWPLPDGLDLEFWSRIAFAEP